MIKIDLKEPTTESWHKWREQCDLEQRRHNDRIESGRASKVKGRVYKGEKYNIKADFYINIDGLFHGKCAYCEQKIYGDQHGDIEHFRPKDAVSDENWETEKIEGDRESREHPGYYWLCYNLNNLLLSCVLCNQQSSNQSGGKLIGKHTRFPVAGFRAILPGEEEQEEPLLINPVHEDPGEHLELEENGAYAWKTERGRVCVEIFGLNDRDLPHERNKMYKAVLQKMGLLAMLLATDPNGAQTEELIAELSEHRRGRNAFTSVAIKAIEDAMRNQETLCALIDDE